MILNVINIVIWMVVAVMYFSTPKEHYTPNWIMGIIGVLLVLDNLLEIIVEVI